MVAQLFQDAHVHVIMGSKPNYEQDLQINISTKLKSFDY